MLEDILRMQATHCMILKKALEATASNFSDYFRDKLHALRMRYLTYRS